MLGTVWVDIVPHLSPYRFTEQVDMIRPFLPKKSEFRVKVGQPHFRNDI